MDEFENDEEFQKAMNEDLDDADFDMDENDEDNEDNVDFNDELEMMKKPKKR